MTLCNDDEEILNSIIEKANIIAEQKMRDGHQIPESIATILLCSWAHSHIENGGLHYFFEMDPPSEFTHRDIIDAYVNINALDVANFLILGFNLMSDERGFYNHRDRVDVLYSEIDGGDIALGIISLTQKIFEHDDVWENLLSYGRRYFKDCQ